MNKYILSCCSTADLTKEQLEALHIPYLPFHFFLDGVEYADDLGHSISNEDFYAAMVNGADTKTSMVAVGEYVDYFTKILSEGNDLLHVTLSSGISGSYRSALAAADIVRAEFPERKLYVVDSLAASAGYGLLMVNAASLRDKGYTIEELRDHIENTKLNLHHWFFSTDLTFYVKGGRVSKVAGFVGGMLNICPLLFVDKEGRLIPHSKIRTKNRVIDKIVDKMVEWAEDGVDYSGKCFISHSACIEDAKAVAAKVEARFPKLDGKVVINNIGTTIGSHTGPGTVALFFVGKDRKDISL